MLLNNFYKITDIIKEENSSIFKVELNPSHSIYKGHFEEQPIVPGVCTLQIIKECAEKVANKELFYSYISSCKFLSLIDPQINKLLEINITLKEIDENQISLLAEGKYQHTETIFIKVKATLKESL